MSKNLVLDIWHGERGIDLSKWKERFDLWGVIIKCGGSDDSYWNRYEETTFMEQLSMARSLGLHVGAYYYSDATTTQMALNDARHCIDKCLKGVSLDMPVYLDIEERAQLDLPMHQLTDVVTTWCEYVRKAGYEPGIYSGYEGFHNMHEDKIRDYSLWVAAWRTSWPLWAKDYDIWQEGSIDIHGNRYHKDNDVDGPGHVDLNWASDKFVSAIESRDKMGKLIDPANVAALIHMDMVTDPRNGYSQSPRWGGDHPDGVKHLKIDGRDYEYALGSMDCSSSSKAAWEQAFRYTAYEGCLGHLGESGATCTSDFCEAFTGTGLFRTALSPARRGDLYITPGDHVAMCQDGGGDGVYGRDCLSEFICNEHGGATGGEVGDQTGGEALMRDYYDYHGGWDTVIHYVGGLLEDITDKSEPSREVGDDMRMLIHPEGINKIYYWDGSIQSVPFHVRTQEEQKALMEFYKLATGRELGIVRVSRQSFEALMAMTKDRMAYNSQRN